MPPPLLFDLSAIPLDRIRFSRDDIYARLPHRAEFMLLDGVCHLDEAARRIVAFHDCRPEAWWAKGHIPGRPLLPGVLMLEMAAQAAVFAAYQILDHDTFIGFGGIDGCKFREAVTPGARLYLLAEGEELRHRRIVSRTQGVCDGRVVFEAEITGLAMK